MGHVIIALIEVDEVDYWKSALVGYVEGFSPVLLHSKPLSTNSGNTLQSPTRTCISLVGLCSNLILLSSHTVSNSSLLGYWSKELVCDT